MRTGYRVARVDELGPGQGKVVLVAGREVTVYNLEGRLRAAGARAGAERGPACVCPPGGRRFDATAADSPARLREPGRAVEVAVEGDFVVIYLD